MDLDTGAVRATGRSLKAAFEDYLEHHNQLRPRTLYVAKVVTAKFIAFAAQHGIATCDKVNRPFILRFRAHLVNEEKRRAKVGGKRGEYVGTGEKRGHDAVNHDLISIRAILGYLCDP